MDTDKSDKSDKIRARHLEVLNVVVAKSLRRLRVTTKYMAQ